MVAGSMEKRKVVRDKVITRGQHWMSDGGYFVVDARASTSWSDIPLMASDQIRLIGEDR
jgi:hypothetical protein